MNITINCPNCNIGMDVDMVHKPPVIFDYFYTGYRTCPNCGYEIDVQLAGHEKGKDWAMTAAEHMKDVMENR